MKHNEGIRARLYPAHKTCRVPCEADSTMSLPVNPESRVNLSHTTKVVSCSSIQLGEQDAVDVLDQLTLLGINGWLLALTRASISTTYQQLSHGTDEAFPIFQGLKVQAVTTFLVQIRSCSSQRNSYPIRKGGPISSIVAGHQSASCWVYLENG